MWTAIAGALFGSKGLVGSIVEILKDTGVLKDPEMVLKAQEALMAYETSLATMDTRLIEAVNATMQAEAKGEHWATWLWRPIVGFTFSAVILNNFILMPYFAKWIVPITLPSEVWTALLVILGAASAGRSWEKVSAINSTTKGK